MISKLSIAAIMLIFSCAAWATDDSDKMCIDKVQIAGLLQTQDDVIELQKLKIKFWASHYKDLASCIRFTAKNNLPATVCLGDAEL